MGTGTLARYTSRSESADKLDVGEDASAAVGGNNPLVVWAITVVAFAVVLFAMAVGVMFGRRAISGSCGSLANSRNEEGSISCSLCSNPDDACKELRGRQQYKS